MAKEKTQNTKSDILEIKKDLVDDLDQFLFDNDIDSANVKEEKQRALNELDKFKSKPIDVDTDNRDTVKDWAIRLVKESSK